MAREFCLVNGVVDYAHLIRTFTLSSRVTFECLDAADRYNNKKTPARNRPSERTTDPSSQPVTPVSRRTRSSIVSKATISQYSKRKNCSPIPKSNVFKKPNSKKSKIIASTSHWEGDNNFCNFCHQQLDLDNLVGKCRSHLLYKCENIPGDGPLSQTARPRSRDRMKRLAEISAVPDPGGE